MSYNGKRISLIIPTLNAEGYIDKLINIINSQTVEPDEIIVIDSESVDRTIELCQKYEKVKVIEVKRESFDHAGTRNQAIQASTGDIILMLSQDVTPIHKDYIEKLISPLLIDENIAACSGRQIAYPDATLREKLVRQFNYKSYSFIRSKTDISAMGIKTFYLSDCCSAYRRKQIDSVGMYQAPTLICSDMILAAKLIFAGYKIAYAAKAEVYHSHDYSLIKQYKRNFDIGAEIEINKALFTNVSTTQEGMKLTKYVLSELLKRGHIIMGIYFCIDCLARYIGHYDGRHYRRYNLNQVKRLSMNTNYWEKTNLLR